MGDYRSPARLGLILRVLLGLWVIASGIAAAASLRQAVVLSNLLDDPLSVSVSEYESVDDRRVLFDVIQVGFFLLVAIVFVVWTRRVYRNLRPLGADGLRFSEGWAVGAWFVPFLNLVRPKQIVDDTWRGSDPRLPAAMGSSWRDRPVSATLHWWWAIYLLTGAVAFIASTQDVTVEQAIEGNRSQAIWYTVGDTLQILVGIFAFVAVAKLTARQQQRAERLVAADATDGQAVPVVGESPTRPLVVAGISALGVAALGISYLAFAGIDDDRSVDVAGESDQPGTGTLLDDLDVGDCLDLPSDFDPTSEEVQGVLAVAVLSCETTHELEVVGFATHPADDDADYPGDVELAQEGFVLCAEPLESYVGAPMWETGLDIFHVQPVPAGWEMGDRGFTCMTRPLTGERLEYSVAGTEGIMGPDERTPWGLQQGECFDDPVGVDQLAVRVVDCDTPHDNETYAVLTHPGGADDDYPGDRALAGYAQTACRDEFDRAVDPAAAGDLDYGAWARPIEQTWWIGHRTITCVLRDPGFNKLDASMLTNGSTTDAPSPSDELADGRDDFNGTLQAGWTSVSDGGLQSVSTFPGFLAMQGPSGGGYEDLFRDPVSANYVIETRVQFSPSSGESPGSAGLAVADDAAEIVTGDPFDGISFFRAEGGIYLHSYVNGVLDDEFFIAVPDNASTQTLFLRIRHETGTYAASFSLDGETWTVVASVARSFTDPVVDIFSGSFGPGLPPLALFDWFSEQAL